MDLKNRIDKLSFKEMAYLASNSPNIEVINLIYQKNLDYLKINFTSNKNTPKNILEEIYKSGVEDDVLIRLLKHKNLSTEIIDDVFENNTKLAYHALDNPNISIDKLKKALKSSNRNILKMIATNTNCPENILRKILNKTADLDVFISLSENKNCSTKLLNDIFKSISIKLHLKTTFFVLNSIASNENISPQLLNKVIKIINDFVLGDDPDFSKIAILNKKIDDKFLKDNWSIINERTRSSLAISITPPFSETKLDLLKNDKSKFVRKNLAKNFNIPKKVLKELENDSYYKVKYTAKDTLIKINELERTNKNVDLDKKFKKQNFTKTRDFDDILNDYENNKDIITDNKDLYNDINIYNIENDF